MPGAATRKPRVSLTGSPGDRQAAARDRRAGRSLLSPGVLEGFSALTQDSPLEVTHVSLKLTLRNVSRPSKTVASSGQF